MPFDPDKSPLKSVCVYCGSSGHVDEEYQQLAGAVGSMLASRKVRVVYGGGKGGLMGCVADAALAAGGEVIGIIPSFIRAREVQHNGLTKLHVVESMHQRKSMMVEMADAFVVLPGGIGTMDETFEILSWKQLGLHNKPIVIFNFNNYWAPFLGLLDHMTRQGFFPQESAGIYRVATTIDDMLGEIAEPVGPIMDPATKWF
jgi:uncharacterized protein (TIGR00730 family)